MSARGRLRLSTWRPASDVRESFGRAARMAASCGPSTLGGIGGIGEGNLGLPIGRSARAQSAGILIATGICTMVIAMVVQPIGG